MAHLPPAINGTEQRLDVLIDEIRGMRADLAARPALSDEQFYDRLRAYEASLKEPHPIPAEPVAVKLKEPALRPVVEQGDDGGNLQPRPVLRNLPPLSDEAGAAMVRALDDGRPKAQPQPIRTTKGKR